MIRSCARCLQALLLVGSLCATGQTFAAPAPSDVASPGAPDAAGELFDKGNAFYHQSRWAEAEVQFQKAWNVKQSFDVAANLGDCELQIGQNREAAEHLAFAVRAFPVSGKPALLERLRQRFAEARALTGGLHIQVDVKGAEITVDGRAVGVAPLADEVFVDPGARVVEARLEGYEIGRANVTAGKGATQEVALTLTRTSVEPIVPPTSGPRLPIVLGGATLGLVALGAGVGLLVASAGKGSDADGILQQMKGANVVCTQPPAPGQCQDIVSLRQSHDTLHNVGVPFLVGGAVVAVATLSYALLSPRAASPKPTGLRVTPIVGAEGGGLWIGGAF